MSRLALLVFPLPFLLACSVAAHEPAKKSGFVGVWDTTFGEMILRQDGILVRGTYSFAGTSSLVGTVEGARLTFRYTETDGSKGEGRFALSKDAKSFTGKWRADGDETWEVWTGKRVIRKPKKRLPFDGLYETSFGRVRLKQRGDQVEGVYLFSGSLGTLKGKIHNKTRRLGFLWREGKLTGDGWFEVGKHGVRLSGQYRNKGEQKWKDWNGQRVRAKPGVKWLMVVESYWEEGLEKREYSFGAMLRAFFRRFPRIKVRHRRFGDRPDFVRALGQVAFLAEPVVVVVASHGEKGGLVAGKDSIKAATIGAALRHAPNVLVLHFSACEMMVGQVPAQIQAALKRKLPISGYAVAVDWSASAVLEFLYLDLILGRGKTPAEAAKLVKQELSFANDEGVKGSPLGSAKFRFKQ